MSSEGTPMSNVPDAAAAPPRAPAPYPDGSRLKYAYNPADRTVTLSWQPSPA